MPLEANFHQYTYGDVKLIKVNYITLHQIKSNPISIVPCRGTWHVSE